MLKDNTKRREKRIDTSTDTPKIGLFIRDFLRQHEEASPSDIHRSYKDTYRGLKTPKGNTRKLGTYQSHVVYISGLVMAGLVERVENGKGEVRFRGDDNVVIEKIHIRLTDKGKWANNYVWSHPLRLWYRPFFWERENYREYIKR